MALLQLKASRRNAEPCPAHHPIPSVHIPIFAIEFIPGHLRSKPLRVR
jgi:hypothetical protein